MLVVDFRLDSVSYSDAPAANTGTQPPNVLSAPLTSTPQTAGIFIVPTKLSSKTPGSTMTMIVSVSPYRYAGSRPRGDKLITPSAFKPNTTNVLVSNLWCNGSHGISVGSLGQVGWLVFTTFVKELTGST